MRCFQGSMAADAMRAQRANYMSTRLQTPARFIADAKIFSTSRRSFHLHNVTQSSLIHTHESLTSQTHSKKKSARTSNISAAHFLPSLSFDTNGPHPHHRHHQSNSCLVRQLTKRCQRHSHRNKGSTIRGSRLPTVSMLAFPPRPHVPQSCV